MGPEIIGSSDRNDTLCVHYRRHVKEHVSEKVLNATAQKLKLTEDKYGVSPRRSYSPKSVKSVLIKKKDADSKVRHVVCGSLNPKKKKTKKKKIRENQLAEPSCANLIANKEHDLMKSTLTCSNGEIVRSNRPESILEAPGAEDPEATSATERRGAALLHRNVGIKIVRDRATVDDYDVENKTATDINQRDSKREEQTKTLDTMGDKTVREAAEKGGISSKHSNEQHAKEGILNNVYGAVDMEQEAILHQESNIRVDQTYLDTQNAIGSIRKKKKKNKEKLAISIENESEASKEVDVIQASSPSLLERSAVNGAFSFIPEISCQKNVRMKKVPISARDNGLDAENTLLVVEHDEVFDKDNAKIQRNKKWSKNGRIKGRMEVKESKKTHKSKDCPDFHSAKDVQVVHGLVDMDHEDVGHEKMDAGVDHNLRDVQNANDSCRLKKKRKRKKMSVKYKSETIEEIDREQPLSRYLSCQRANVRGIMTETSGVESSGAEKCLISAKGDVLGVNDTDQTTERNDPLEKSTAKNSALKNTNKDRKKMSLEIMRETAVEENEEVPIPMALLDELHEKGDVADSMNDVEDLEAIKRQEIESEVHKSLQGALSAMGSSIRKRKKKRKKLPCSSSEKEREDVKEVDVMQLSEHIDCKSNQNDATDSIALTKEFFLPSENNVCVESNGLDMEKNSVVGIDGNWAAGFLNESLRASKQGTVTEVHSHRKRRKVHVDRETEIEESSSFSSTAVDIKANAFMHPIAEGEKLHIEKHFSEASCPNHPKKKLLVLDINGVLADVVAGSHPGYHSDAKVSKKSVFKRPFCYDFLRFCFEKFNVGIWSSRQKGNLRAIVKILFEGYEGNLLFCWDGSKCSETGFKTLENRRKPLVLKELSKLWKHLGKCRLCKKQKYNESNTLLVDDSPYKSLRNPLYTAVFPHAYQYEDAKDSSLGPEGDLRLYLKKLADSDNVQKFVKENPFGQPGISESHPSWRFYRKFHRKDRRGGNNAVVT